MGSIRGFFRDGADEEFLYDLQSQWMNIVLKSNKEKSKRILFILEKVKHAMKI